MTGRPRGAYHVGRLGLFGLVTAVAAAALAAGVVIAALGGAARHAYSELARSVWMIAALPVGVAAAVAVALTLRALRVRSRAGAQALATSLALLGAGATMLLRYIAEPAALAFAPETTLAGLRLPSALPPLDLLLLDGAILALISAFALDAGATQLAGAYCTACGRRSRRSLCAVDRAPAPPERALSGLRRRDWRFFRRLGPPTTRSRARLRFVLYSCPCGLTRALRLNLLRRSRRIEIVREMQLGPDDVRTIRALGREDDAVSREWESSTAARLARASGAS